MRETKTFDRELWDKGTRAEMDLPNEYPYIKNMQQYGGGALGPRSGWKAFLRVTSSTPNTYAVFCAPFYYGGSPRDCIVVASTDGLDMYQVLADADPAGTLMATLVTGINSTSVWRISDTQWLIGNYLYLFRQDSVGAKPYGITRTAMDTTIATEFGYSAFALAGGVPFAGRAFYWGNANTTGTDPYGEERRLYYSDPYAFTTFTEGVATQYIQIDRPIKGAFVLSGAMYIYDTGGYWWKLDLNNSGDPQDGYLRIIGQGLTPKDPLAVALVDQTAFFFSDNGMLCAFDEDGLDDQTLGHLAPLRQAVTPKIGTGSDSKTNIIYLPWFDDTNSPTVGRAYVFQGGSWWYEERQNNQGLGIYTNVVHNDMIGNEESPTTRNSIIMHATRDFVASPYYHQIHTRTLDLDYPATQSDTYANDVDEEYVNGTAADTTGALGAIHLPRLHGEAHQFVRIQKVTVDCQYWKKSGTWPTATMTCTVVDANGGSHTGVSDLVTASLADTSIVTKAPGYVRIEFTFDSDPFTHWAEVRLTGIASLAIEQVHVDFELEQRLW